MDFSEAGSMFERPGRDLRPPFWVDLRPPFCPFSVDFSRWFRVLAGFEYWRYIGHAFQFFVLDPLLIGVPVFGAGAGTCFWIPILEPGQAPSFAAGISGDSERLTEPEGFGESL